MSLKQKLTDQQRLEFAKQIEYMFEAAHPGWGKVIWLSLIKGIATGFGVVIGGTIVVALIVWILGSLDSVPFLGDLAENTKSTIERSE
jgi:hypothetical protein